MRKTVLFFCLLILGTIAISDCPGENTEEVFLNVGEQKVKRMIETPQIFNLNTMYRELDKLLITKNATQQFGRVQDGDVLLKSPVQLSFASYSDYVVLNDEGTAITHQQNLTPSSGWASWDYTRNNTF